MNRVHDNNIQYIVNKHLKIEPVLFLEISYIYLTNSHNFVMSAWPVPTYLDCTIESNNIINRISCTL